jgi:hypothetical protein
MLLRRNVESKILRCFLSAFAAHVLYGMVNNSKRKSKYSSLFFAHNMATVCALNILSRFYFPKQWLPVAILSGLPFFMAKKCSSLISLSVASYTLYEFCPIPGSVLFAICQIPIMHAFVHDPSLLSRKYSNWVHKMGRVTEDNMRCAFNSRDNFYPKTSKPCCQWLHRGSSCGYAAVKEITVSAGLNILPMYLKINLLAAMWVKKIFRKSARSTLFLWCYIFTVRLTLCFAFLKARKLTGILAGFFSGCSIILETKLRREQLGIFCLPQALHVLCRLLSIDVSAFSNGILFLCHCLLHNKVSGNMSKNKQNILKILWGL